MSTPYRFTPRAPAAPHSTPISAAHGGGLAQRRATRAPAVNPFEKFTQNDFESWIAGMTGALRRSLGQDVDVGQAPQQTAMPESELVEETTAGIAYQPVGIDTEEDDDDHFEDSFADIKARRATRKGKGRDPREGPGLGAGAGRQQEEAIEILSGSEEDKVEGYKERHEILPYVESGDEVGEEEEGDELELYEDDEDSQGFLEDDESRAGSPHKGYAAHKEEILRAIQGYNPHENTEEYEEYGSSDGEEAPKQRHNGRQEPPEIIELDLDDDDDDDAQPVGRQSLKDEPTELHRGSSPPVEEDERDMLDEDDEPFSYDRVKDGDHHSGNEEAEIELLGIRGEGEVQSLDDDDAFPPKTHMFVDAEYERPDIRDPWSGPRTYAEDFYSGGDGPLRHGQHLDAHHIEDEEEEDIEPLDEDEDGVFVPEKPEGDEHSAQVQLHDVWEGPEMYAEDYYSGGNLNFRLGQAAKPDRLGPELLTGIMGTDYDGERVEALPAASAPFSGSQGAMQPAWSPLGASVVAERESNERAPSDVFQGTQDDGRNSVEPAVELQDGQTVSDADPMDADLDLEYPEPSRTASVAGEPPAIEDTSPSVGAPGVVVLADADGDVVEEPIPLGRVEPDAEGVVLTEVIDQTSSVEADDLQAEDDHTGAETLEGTDAYQVEGMARSSEGESVGISEVEPPGTPYESFNEQLREATQAEWHAVEAADNLLEARVHDVTSTVRHTVRLEEVLDDDTNEPIQAPVIAEAIMGAVNDDSVDKTDKPQEGALLEEAIISDGGEDYGMDDHDDEDAYGEPENEDMEVLSITSSEDFHVLGHVEDEEEVGEASLGEATMDLDPEGNALVPGGQAANDLQEVSPLVVSEGSVSFTLEKANAGEGRVGGEFHTRLVLNGATELLNDESLGEPAPPTPSSILREEAEPSSPDTCAEDSTGRESYEGAFEQPREPTLNKTEDSSAELSVGLVNALEGQAREELDEDPFAGGSALVLDEDVDAKPLDVSATREEEVVLSTRDGPPAEGQRLSVDGVVSARATSPPESVLEAETATTQALLDSEISPEPSVLTASSTNVQTGAAEATPLIESAGPLSEKHSGSSIPVIVPSQLPTGFISSSRASLVPQPPTLGDLTNDLLAADDQKVLTIEGEAPRSEAAQSTEAETLSENAIERDKPDVNYLPSPQSIADVEMGIDRMSPSAGRPNPEPYSATAHDDTKSAPSEAPEQTSSAQPEPSADAETVEALVEREYSAPREVTVSTQGAPIQVPSASSTEEPQHEPTDLDVVAENAPPELRPKFRTISQPPHSQSTSTTKSVSKGNAGKRKRDGPSPKKGPRGGAGSRKKSTKGKGKEKRLDDAHLDGEEIIAIPKKRSKLTESHPASVGERPRPPASTSATSVQSGSSASSAARLLQPSSRASSVAPSEASGQTQPSPTTSKPPGFPKSQRGSGGFVHYNLVTDSQPQAPSPLLQATSAAQRPFLHAHGKRKAPPPLQTYRTMPAPVPVAQQPIVPPQTLIPAAPHPPPLPPADQNHHNHTRRLSAAHRTSIPPPSPSSSHPPTSPQQDAPPQTPTSSVGQLSQAPTPQGPVSGARRTQSMKTASSATHTPITRSHCRFHKISLPKEELGPRIFFIVPGCSLTRYRVIEDEEVEDHGDATYEESQRMVEDIETLDLDPYIIKVLKSLVGSEIMQQREVYYLPLPGETVVRQASTSTAHATSTASKGRASGATYTSISSRGKIGGDTALEELGISETDSDDKSSDDSDYNAKPVARTKHAGRKGAAQRKPTKVSNKRSRATVAQDPTQVDEAEEGRVGKKTKLDEALGTQPGPATPAHS